MMLVLKVVGPSAGQLGASARQTFDGAGGSIGRLADNHWVIPSQYISGRHARIHFRDDGYFLEDTSSNGVFFGTRDNRLPKGQNHRLQAGDRFFIDEFEIVVELDAPAPAFAPAPARPAASMIPDDIFGSEPVVQSSSALLGGPTAETDPLKALGLGDVPRAQPVPRLEDIERASPMRERVQLPEARSPQPVAPPPAATGEFQIPDDYNPLIEPRPAGATAAPPRQQPTPPLAPPPPSPPKAVVPPAPKPKLPEPTRTEAPPAPRPRIAVPEPRTPPADTSTTRTGRQPQLDLIALLEAAGVPPGAATPGVARELGEILRIVVAGVMDVLAARDKIKEEFRIRQTTFKSTDNNPLKFSANAEDALYNLLVKRNPAYLGPVDAFEDGFADLRNHQLAMLAGMRVAYEAMLRRFDPERLRERFDEKGTRGALLPMPGRMRYWEQFGEHYRDMVKDPEASFRELFGAEFTRAYEEQMLRLRTLGRSQKRGS